MAKYMHCIVQEGVSCSEIQHLNHSSTVQKLRINRMGILLMMLSLIIQNKAMYLI